MSYDPIKYLTFAYDRMIVVHGENPHYDYMIRFKEAIRRVAEEPQHRQDMDEIHRQRVSLRLGMGPGDFTWEEIEKRSEELFLSDRDSGNLLGLDGYRRDTVPDGIQALRKALYRRGKPGACQNCGEPCS